MDKFNFSVVLFKNNKKKKILKSFITEKKAIEYYENQLKKSNECRYNRKYENGKECVYKIGIISSLIKPDGEIYYTDDIGRTIIVNPKISDGIYLLKMSNFNKPETFYDCQTKNKISFEDFKKKYISNKNFYMMSKLNNKLIIQNDEVVNLFSFKNEYECERFCSFIQSELNFKNFMIVLDTSSAQKKYLYELLIEKGFDKQYLYRKTTTHPR